jgi:hypothetical protein
MRRSAAFALVLLAACGGTGEADEAPDTNEIRRLSTPGNSAEDTKAGSASIGPLRPEDLAALGEGGAQCRFLRNDQLLVAASGTDAVARVGGELRHFVQTAAADESGIFLEDRQVSISIGRADPAGEAARLTVTNRRTEVQERWAGSWRCGA